VSHLQRLKVARKGRARQSADEPLSATATGSLLNLQAGAGNRAVARLLAPARPALQRKLGWANAVTDGYGWNVDERLTGKLKTIRRIPLEGFGEGLQDDRAIAALTPESAKDRAIVLVPKTLDAGKPIEVLVFLHGFTEGKHRPFAGWRTLPKLKDRPEGKPNVEPLRQGIDTKDVAPVRDVALDDAPQQLEDSGLTQTVFVLPQGGLKSQFGKAGDYNFDSHTYTHKVVERLQAEHVWKDASGKDAAAAPTVGRISMAGNSGAGATLSNMAKESVIPGSARASGILMGDLLLYDAMNSQGQLNAFKDWALMHLDNALIVVTMKDLDDATKFKYLREAQKLRSYATGGGYQTRNDALKEALERWFRKNAKKLGKFEAALRSNFVVTNVNEGRRVAFEHEEMMRGAKAGKARAAGAGGILDALKGLHRP
jgi:hypothetical protein